MSQSALALRAHLENELRANLLRGDYEGIEVKFQEWLHASAPYEFKDREELRQQVVFYCLEAVKIYDPIRGMKFSTFLFQHLRLRCMTFQKYMWLRGSGSKKWGSGKSKCRMLPILQKVSRVHGDNATDHHAYDGDSHVREFTIPSEAEISCVIQELLAAMSIEGRLYLLRLLEYEDQEKLIRAFGSVKFKKIVAGATGLTAEQVQLVADEVRSKLPPHLEDTAA